MAELPRGRTTEADKRINGRLFSGQGDNGVASWELRVEGRLLDDSKNDPNKVRGPAAPAVGRSGVIIARSPCCR